MMKMEIIKMETGKMETSTKVQLVRLVLRGRVPMFTAIALGMEFTVMVMEKIAATRMVEGYRDGNAGVPRETCSGS